MLKQKLLISLNIEYNFLPDRKEFTIKQYYGSLQLDHDQKKSISAQDLIGHIDYEKITRTVST